MESSDAASAMFEPITNPPTRSAAARVAIGVEMRREIEVKFISCFQLNGYLWKKPDREKPATRHEA